MQLSIDTPGIFEPVLPYVIGEQFPISNAQPGMPGGTWITNDNGISLVYYSSEVEDDRDAWQHDRFVSGLYVSGFLPFMVMQLSKAGITLDLFLNPCAIPEGS